MHHHSTATAMAQRTDLLRGLSPRESSLALNYAAGPRGGWADLPHVDRRARSGVHRDHACKCILAEALGVVILGVWEV